MEETCGLPFISAQQELHPSSSILTIDYVMSDLVSYCGPADFLETTIGRSALRVGNLHTRVSSGCLPCKALHVVLEGTPVCLARPVMGRAEGGYESNPTDWIPAKTTCWGKRCLRSYGQSSRNHGRN